MYPRTLVVTAFLTAAAVTRCLAQTTGYLLPCSSARQLARGCTSLPGAPDATTALANPAGLAWSGPATLSLTAGAFMPRMTYSNAWNSAATGAPETYPIPAIAYAHPAGNRFGFALGAQTLGGMGAEYQLTHPLLGPNQRYHSEFGLMEGGAALAFRATPQLSVGVTIGAVYGRLEFATPYSASPTAFAGLAGLAQDPDYAPLFSQFTEATAYAELTDLSGFALAGGGSLEFRPSPRVTLALAYAAPLTLTMGGGTALMDMNAQFAQLYQALVAAKGGNAAVVDSQLAAFGIDPAAGMATRFDAEVNFGVPQTLTLSVGVRPAASLSLGADVGWIGYRTAFADMPLALTNGSNPNINILMNANPSNGSYSAAWQTGWKNSLILRGGVEYAVRTDLRVRGGLVYGSDPVPSQTLFTVFPAIVQTAATLGVGYDFGRATLDLGYAHTFAREQRASTPHTVAQEYAGSTNRLLENLVSAGLSWRF